ncbi:MAG: hypothetical protein KatS3mg081_0374 [Gemmatimonadales bacterium]|nr:hypothetical protein HRbin33_02429 [bacterium HR33]GIW51019.1 MAG: hypothetical protein KatS3mg081_0374 [Gemmatimonadales bacterium]
MVIRPQLNPHLAAWLLLGWIVVAGCNDPFAGEATFENVIDTTTLYALRDTPIRLPSAYSLLDRSPIRTDTTSAFDFAFDIDANGKFLIYPPGALGLTRDPGVQLMDRRFEEIKSAPEENYITDRPIEVAANQVFIVRSRPSFNFCLFFGQFPRYGKFRVLEVNREDRSITLELLVNINCGFRSLEPGLPSS